MRRIRLLSVDDERGASTRYRVLAHLPALAAAGWDARVRYPLGSRLADLVRDALTPRGDDVWLVHRKTYPPPFDRFLRAPGRTLVFDLDDAIDLPPPGRDLGPRDLARYRRNFEATVGRADLVLCGNRELAARVGHDRFALLPTPIDAERFRPESIAQARGPVLGWVGHSDNLPYLERLAEPLGELARRRPEIELVVVADRPPKLPGLPVRFERWTLERELACFDGIAVGLMPLDDTPWARAKCSFKALQYMALGIPTVASPIGMNRDVLRHGETGFLPSTDREWVEVLDTLLGDPALARRIGAAGRAVVERSYSLPVVSRRLIELVTEAAA